VAVARRDHCDRVIHQHGITFSVFVSVSVAECVCEFTFETVLGSGHSSLAQKGLQSRGDDEGRQVARETAPRRVPFLLITILEEIDWRQADWPTALSQWRVNEIDLEGQLRLFAADEGRPQ